MNEVSKELINVGVAIINELFLSGSTLIPVVPFFNKFESGNLLPSSLLTASVGHYINVGDCTDGDRYFSIDIPYTLPLIFGFGLSHNKKFLLLLGFTMGVSVTCLVNWYIKKDNVGNFTRNNIEMGQMKSVVKMLSTMEKTIADLKTKLTEEASAESRFELGTDLDKLLAETRRDQALYKVKLKACATPDSSRSDRYISAVENTWLIRHGIGQGSGPTDTSSMDSFFSGVEDLPKDIISDELATAQNFPLYRDALLEVAGRRVLCTKLRTQFMGCHSDSEYLAKLHCIRQAFSHLFSDPIKKVWLIDSSRVLLERVIQRFGFATEDSLTAYDELVSFLKTEQNQKQALQELRDSGYLVPNLYDIIFDGVADVINGNVPIPASLSGLLQNRWITDSFKKSGLTSALYTLFYTQKQCLSTKDGFMSRLFDMFSTALPALAWGYIGPDEELKELSTVLLGNVVLFLKQIFSHDSVCFVSVESLSEDVFRAFEVLKCDSLCLFESL